jgi:hypothetical protein
MLENFKDVESVRLKRHLSFKNKHQDIRKNSCENKHDTFFCLKKKKPSRLGLEN